MEIWKEITKKTKELIGTKCDTCGKDTEKGEFVPIELRFDFPHFLDDMKYDFCSEECAIDFLQNEISKRSKK